MHSQSFCFYYQFAFPFKLHSILENSGKLNQEHIISWLPSGKAFKIHKPKEFANVIMPQYFNQTKYRSFQRQLYIYGFDRHREKSSEDCGAYYHELFIRGVSDLCLDMQRKKIKGTGLSNEERRRKAQQESCVKKIIHNDTSSLMKKQTKKRKSSSSSSSSSSSQKQQPKRSLLPPSLKTTKMMKPPSSSLSTATVPIAAAGVLSTAAPCFIPSMPLSMSIATASSISSNKKQQENMMMAMLLNPSLDLQSSSSTKAQQLQQQQPPRRVSEWNNELKSFISSVKPALNKQEIQHEQLQMQQQQRARSRRVSELMQMQSSISNNGTNNNTISSGSSSSMTQKQATLHNCLSSEFGIPFDPTMGGRRCSLGFVRTAARRNSLLHDGEQIDFNNKKFFFTSQYN